MKFLQENNPLGANHPAVKQYNKCMRGAGDTVRSIIISANSRLAFLENKQVLRLLSKDDLNLPEIGIGVNGDGETKTALFCVIPDSDKSYNFIIGMLYTQIFQIVINHITSLSECYIHRYSRSYIIRQISIAVADYRFM